MPKKIALSAVKKTKTILQSRKEIIPTAIIIVATLTILIIGYSINNQKKIKSIKNDDAWKISQGVYLPLQINNFSPKSGPTEGKNEIIITGQGFNSTTKIYLGVITNSHQRILPISTSKITPKQIKAIIPSHPAGKVDIYSIYNGNIISPKYQYEYIGEIPNSNSKIQINSIVPGQIPLDKKQHTVLITGNGFGKINKIKFGQGTIDNISSADGKQLQFTLPTMISTPVGNQPISPNKYDISIISNNIESNFVTIEIMR